MRGDLVSRPVDEVLAEARALFENGVKELLVVSFDPVLAATLRLPVEPLRILILLLLAVTIVASLPAVGVGLVAAMLVTPPATASLLTRRLPPMMLISAVLGAASGFTGIYLSFYLNVASGAAVVLVATGLFGAVYLLHPHGGLLRDLATASEQRRAVMPCRA